MRHFGSGLIGALGLLVMLNMGGCGGIVDKEVEEQMLQDLGETQITVFPVYVRDGVQGRYDPNAAREIGAEIERLGLATVTYADADIPITSKWGSNEARMWRDSAADFTSYLGTHPIDTRYALLVEYLVGGQGLDQGGKVLGVHYYIARDDAVLAGGGLANSHHEDFQAVNPQTIADCTTVMKRLLDSRLKARMK